MKILVDRKWKKETYTIGNLYINGKLFCNTLEDRDRGLKKTDSLSVIKSKKVYGETAIPTGKYGVAMNITSPKYSAVKWYWNLCKGMMPRLLNVPGFEGILIHPGNTPFDSKLRTFWSHRLPLGRNWQSWATSGRNKISLRFLTWHWS